MRSPSLFALIASALASATGAACAVFQSCPETVVDREFDVSVTPAAVCATRPQYGVPGLAACRTLCNDTRVTQCTLDSDFFNATAELQGPDAGSTHAADSGSGDAAPFDPAYACPLPPRVPEALKLHCLQTHTEGTYHDGCPIDGRRPAGLHEDARGDSATVGAYFAKCGYLEAASVIAFERLHDELLAHGAPAELCVRTLRARDDEQRHARVVGALAVRFGAIVAPVVADAPRERSLFEIARENVVEGVVRETFAAALAMHKAAYAGDATVRATLQEITYDECRHGELSLAIDRWIRGRLTSAERASLDEAALEAIAELRAELESEPPPELVEIAGLPRSREARRLVDALTSLLWRQTSLAA